MAHRSPSRRLHARRRLLAATLCAAGAVQAAQTLPLPPASCATDVTMASGFEQPNAAPAAFSTSRSIYVPGYGMRTYYVHAPAGFPGARRWPALLALHGAAGPGNAPAAAQATRDAWAATAAAAGFVVAAPASNGSQGGWGVAADFAMLEAILADLQGQWHAERGRLYLWGFSAGGHFGHALALDNPDLFAAYAVSAGSLSRYACSVPPDTFAPACATYLPAVARKVPLDIHIGTADPLYPQVAADPARLLGAGWAAGELNYVEFGAGHTYDPAQFPQMWAHLCRYALVLP